MTNIFRVSHILQLANVDFFKFSKRVQILKTEYKYGKYCTPLTQSDYRYFFVLAIIAKYEKRGNISQYFTISCAITTLPLYYHSILLLQPY